MQLAHFFIFALVAALNSTKARAKAVFAHVIVGNCASMTLDDWKDDVYLAKNASIDAFALNIGADDYTSTALQYAYAAAEALGNFSMFISFDYAAHTFTSSEVISYITTYQDSSAQFKIDGQPLVSTFEGPDNQDDWADIKTQTNCFFAPDWSSLGASSSFPVDKVDGALSWDAWPDGATDKTTDTDEAWMDILGDKAYIMPASPWFYTNLPTYSKNWLWRGDDLWYHRWQQIIELQPDFVEILTWNDYGESSYVGPVHTSGIPTGAERYSQNNSHTAWLEVLPHYIAAYKSSNSTTLKVTDDKVIYWYRPNPSSSGSNGGTTGNDPAYQDTVAPSLVSVDGIYFDAIVRYPSTVRVKIGDSYSRTFRAMRSGINHFSMPFNGQTGSVKFTVTRNNETILQTTGHEITESCDDGLVNWNAIVGHS